MTDYNARLQMPLFAASDYSEEKNRADRLRAELRLEMQNRVEKAKKRYGLALIVLFAWAASMMVGCCLTGWIVHNRTEKEVTERVTHEMRAAMQAYLEEQETQQKAASFLSGEASTQAAIDSIAGQLAPLIAGLRMDGRVTTEGAYTYGWTVIARLQSGKYGNSIAEVLSNAGQYEYYNPEHGTREEDVAIARQIASDYINGTFPDGYFSGIEFCQINADGSVTARDDFYTGSTTNFWKYKG